MDCLIQFATQAVPETSSAWQNSLGKQVQWKSWVSLTNEVIIDQARVCVVVTASQMVKCAQQLQSFLLFSRHHIDNKHKKWEVFSRPHTAAGDCGRLAICPRPPSLAPLLRACATRSLTSCEPMLYSLPWFKRHGGPRAQTHWFLPMFKTFWYANAVQVQHIEKYCCTETVIQLRMGGGYC